MSARVLVKLYSDGLGESATKADYEDWVRHVSNQLDELTGLDCHVEPSRWGDAGRDGTRDSEHEEVVLEALRDLWESWCEGGFVPDICPRVGA